MKVLCSTALLLGVSYLSAATPDGVSDNDWTSIRAAHQAWQHRIEPNADGTHTAHNPGLGWQMTFDKSGFTATNGTWTWGLELATAPKVPITAPRDAPSAPPPHPPTPHLAPSTATFQRSPHLTEWFINDHRGLEQGWTLSAPADITLRVRGTLKPTVTPQSISFGNQITYTGLKAWDATGKTVPTHFEPTSDGFTVRYDATAAQYPITIDPIAQNAYLKASNTDANDNFGRSVAVSGDTVVVGAEEEDSNATGVNDNGNQSNNDAQDSGAAYVFTRTGSTWTQQAYLKASNTGVEDYFGNSVAVSGDTVVVGAHDEDSNATGVNGNQSNNDADGSGAVYVFTRSGSTWSQQAYLKASNTGGADSFGWSVALSGDTLVVGAYTEDSNATGVNDARNQGNNSAFNSGAAYVFTRNGSTWSQQAYLKASNTGVDDTFGQSVAVSGDTVVVGADDEASNATGVNGNQSNNDARDSGAAYVFTRSGSTWTQQAYLKASNTGAEDRFGTSVAVSGDTVVIGAILEDSNATGVNGNGADNSASLSGAAYVFTRSGSTWTQQAYLKASNTGVEDTFGQSVAVSGDTVVVGADQEASNATGVNGNQSNNDTDGSGAAYVFTRTGSTWTQQAYLKASNTGANASFGWSVAVSEDTVVIGAYEEDSDATGVNSDATNNNAANAGSAYVFSIGEILTSLSRSTSPAPGGPNLTFGISGFGAISPTGETLFESALSGAGAPSGKNKALFSTVASPLDRVDMALQTGSFLSGVLGLPTGAKVTTITNAVHNRNSSEALFQATVSGPGLTPANNRLLFTDNGTAITPILRTGLPLPTQGHQVPAVFTEVLQHLEDVDAISLNVSFKLGAGQPAVTTASDSGLLLLTNRGATISKVVEGGPAFEGGTFGQIGRATHVGFGLTRFLAKWVPAPGQTAKDAAFLLAGVNDRSDILQGDLAGDTSNGERYGTFLGITRIGANGLIRCTLRTSPVASNEGLWDDTGRLYLRKGVTELGGGLKVARFLRVWGGQYPTFYALVTLSGDGVTASNNQALIFRQQDDNFLILARTGTQAPGIGVEKIKLRTLNAVDVNADLSETSGHYFILATLSGAASNANQVLLSGNTKLGNDASLANLRLPKLLLRKGDLYSTAVTPSANIRSIAIKPVVDPTGFGGRGLGQIINNKGEVMVNLTDLNGAQELVNLTP